MLCHPEGIFGLKNHTQQKKIDLKASPFRPVDFLYEKFEYDQKCEILFSRIASLRKNATAKFSDPIPYFPNPPDVSQKPLIEITHAHLLSPLEIENIFDRFNSFPFVFVEVEFKKAKLDVNSSESSLVSTLVLSNPKFDVVFTSWSSVDFLIDEIHSLFINSSIVKVFYRDLKKKLLVLQENFKLFLINTFSFEILFHFFQIPQVAQIFSFHFRTRKDFSTLDNTSPTRHWLRFMGTSKASWFYQKCSEQLSCSPKWWDVVAECCRYNFLCLVAQDSLSFGALSSAQCNLLTDLRLFSIKHPKIEKYFSTQREKQEFFWKFVTEIFLDPVKISISYQHFSAKFPKIKRLLEKHFNSNSFFLYYPLLFRLNSKTHKKNPRIYAPLITANLDSILPSQLSITVHPPKTPSQEFVRSVKKTSQPKPPSKPKIDPIPNRKPQTTPSSSRSSTNSSQKDAIDSQHISRLSSLIIETHQSISLTLTDYSKRESTRNELEFILKQKFPTASLGMFGSSVNLLGFRNSDIDFTIKSLSLNKEDYCLKKVCNHLRKSSRVSSICYIAARVPIIKFVFDKVQPCDISLDNGLALENSKLIALYVSIDPRVPQLICAVKKLAKICRINDASMGTLSSYSYTLMVIHFLQRLDPPVLPCLQEIQKTAGPKIAGCDCYYFKDLSLLPQYFQQENTASVANLFLEFLLFPFDQFKYKKYVITIRTLAPLTKTQKDWNHHTFAIEDPFNLSHCTSGSLSHFGFTSILHQFRLAHLHFLKNDFFPHYPFRM